MPTLHWIGKDKVINHHRDVPFHVLDEKYTFHTEGEQSDNKIIHGDNLLALKSLLPQYEGKIKCIYIDPPYNTGNEGWVYNDNVNDPKIKKWLAQTVGKEGEDLSRHDKWLCMMYPRLKLLHQLLATDGVIMLSIGDDELENTIFLLNEIWGKNNSLGIFLWKSRAKPTNAGEAKFRVQKVSEYVLLYAKKSQNVNYNALLNDTIRTYPHKDSEGSYRITTILTSNLGVYQRETMRFTIGDFTPNESQRWKGGYDMIDDLYKKNRLEFRTGIPMRKHYDFEEEELHYPFYTFIETEVSGTAENGKNDLTKILGSGHGFDTVKPTSLINYFLKVFADKNSIILDSFAGSGTTAHAVLNLNKQDGGNRKFILIEMEDYAESITAERVKRVIKGYSNTEGVGGSFAYSTLGEPLFDEDGNLNEKVPTDTIRTYVFYTETEQYIKDQAAAIDGETPHFMGIKDTTAYYFYYEKERMTTLDLAFLQTVRTRADMYIIYADNTLLSLEFLKSRNIIFKKIPRDVRRF